MYEIIALNIYYMTFNIFVTLGTNVLVNPHPISIFPQILSFDSILSFRFKIPDSSFSSSFDAKSQFCSRFFFPRILFCFPCGFVYILFIWIFQECSKTKDRVNCEELSASSDHLKSSSQKLFFSGKQH